MALALAIAFQSCSSSGLVVREYEYDPQSAEAYYYGENEYEAGRYGLVFIAGRTDEDANLVSHGATLVLMLTAPVADIDSLPSGTYSAGNLSGTYTFDYGTLTDKDVVEGSYVSVRSRGETRYYPVEGGTVEIRAGDDGLYEIRAEIFSSGCSFGFEYSGVLPVYNCSSPV